MILRPDYIEAVRPFIDAPLVKILSGIRRCGKSTIFLMLREEFLNRRVSEKNIISRCYTDQELDSIDQESMYKDRCLCDRFQLKVNEQ